MILTATDHTFRANISNQLVKLKDLSKKSSVPPCLNYQARSCSRCLRTITQYMITTLKYITTPTTELVEERCLLANYKCFINLWLWFSLCFSFYTLFCYLWSWDHRICCMLVQQHLLLVVFVPYCPFLLLSVCFWYFINFIIICIVAAFDELYGHVWLTGK